MMKRTGLIAVLVGGALLLATAAAAQQVPSRRTPAVAGERTPPPVEVPAATPRQPASQPRPATLPRTAVPPAGSAETIALEDLATVSLPINKARLVPLPASAANVILANEGVADVHFDPASPNRMFLLGRQVGTTTLFVMDAGGAIIHSTDLRVDLDSEGVASAIRALLPGEAITVSVFQGQVFLTGKARSPAAATNAVMIANRFLPQEAAAVNMIQVQGNQQVLLQARITEMDRTIIKNMAVTERFNRTIVGQRGISFNTSSPTIANGGTAYIYGTLSPHLAGFGITDPTFAGLEREGLVKTLAEPTLTAVSGETARMLVGSQVAFPTGRDDNGNLVWEWRDVGVRMHFSPVVLDDGRINLQVQTEVSAVGDSRTIAGVTIPDMNVKRTDTVIDLPSGGTLMISGLLENKVTDLINGVPGLKDIPVLGALFRSNEFQHEETELVILVTPFLAKPMNRGTAATPVDGFAPPSDIDFMLLGRLHKEYTDKGDVPFWRLPFKVEGPFGYIMERTP